MPLALDEYVDLSGLEGREYSDSRSYLCELGHFGGYSDGNLEDGDFDVLKDLDVDGLLNYGPDVHFSRACELGQNLDFDNDFTDRFRGELEEKGFGERPLQEYLSLMSRLVGGIPERLSSDLIEKLKGMKVTELVGLYYRCILNLEKYLPRSTEKDLDRYGHVTEVEGSEVINNYKKQILLSVIPGLCRWIITQKRSPDDDNFYPFEVVHPNPHPEDLHKHCLKLLRFAIGPHDKNRTPLQESVILKEVSCLAEKYLPYTPVGEYIMSLVLKVKAYRMGASMYQSQVNATVYRGDTTKPLVHYHSPDGVNVAYGSGVPPFVEAEASFKHPDASFFAVDKNFEDGDSRKIDLSEHGLSDEPFTTPGNVTYVGIDLDSNLIDLPDEISGSDSVDTAVFGSLLHKLRGEIGILVDYVLARQLKEGGKCVVISPAWSDHLVWLNQLFQDSTVNPHAILPVKDLLLVPRYMREMHGIRVQIDSMGILLDSEENDTLNRFQIVYEVVDKGRSLRSRLSRVLGRFFG